MKQTVSRLINDKVAKVPRGEVMITDFVCAVVVEQVLRNIASSLQYLVRLGIS